MNQTFADLLGRVFDESRDYLSTSLTAEEYKQLRQDFIFHMTDWASDLERLHSLSRTPEQWSADDATSFVIGMLYHVIPHLKAAGRILLDDVGDPFSGDKTDQILTKLNNFDATAG
jgi:hypothetical protein